MHLTEQHLPQPSWQVVCRAAGSGRHCARAGCGHHDTTCPETPVLQAHQEYERRLKEELEVKAAKEQEIADLVRGLRRPCCHHHHNIINHSDCGNIATAEAACECHLAWR